MKPLSEPPMPGTFVCNARFQVQQRCPLSLAEASGAAWVETADFELFAADRRSVDGWQLPGVVAFCSDAANAKRLSGVNDGIAQFALVAAPITDGCNVRTADLSRVRMLHCT